MVKTHRRYLSNKKTRSQSRKNKYKHSSKQLRKTKSHSGGYVQCLPNAVPYGADLYYPPCPSEKTFKVASPDQPSGCY
jgi:hypothetical protein